MRHHLKRAYRRVFPAPTLGQILTQFANSHPQPVPRPKNPTSQIEVIIPCYNHGAYLKEAYQSVLDQTWKQKRVTVTFIDDNSTDDTPQIIAGLLKQAPKHLQLKSLHNPSNLRQWASLNRAIRESKNQLIIILNDDDMLTPDALEKIVYAFEHHPELYLVGGSSLWFENQPLPKHAQQPAANLSFDVFAPAAVKNYTELNDLNMTHTSTAFLRSAWEAVGGYTPKDGRIRPDANEDRDIQMRINALVPVGVYSNYPLAYWRTDSSHGKDF